MLEKQNPVTCDDRACEMVLASASNYPQATKSLHEIQAARLRILTVEVFEARCDARAILYSEALIHLHPAVDELQAAAEAAGLVRDLGQDAVQLKMSNAFRKWRGEC